VCWYSAFDSIKWFSTSDVSFGDGTLVCTRVELPPSGQSLSGWARLWKLAQLIERFPW
jgi:hypothetical protein